MTPRPDQKQDTRRRIVAAAAARIQDEGLEAPSVAQVMGDAGLTVGGFYAHFDSRDTLIAEALARMLEDQLQRWLEMLPDAGPAERRAQAARGYLSRRNRDTGAERCPIPAIASEVERADPRIREVVAEHFDAWVSALTDPDEPDGRRHALAAVATMVGALTLARALGPTPFSDELLAAAKAAIR
jgi:TetR/AcrR family transcriptional repressor of nem operon